MPPDDAGDERALVEAATSGDEAAFASLVRARQGFVRALLTARVKERRDVDDLAQEVFLRAWRRLGDLEDPDRFAAWLARIAVNAALDHRRRGRVRPAPGPLGEGGDEPPAAGPGVEHRAVLAEEHARVLEALATLDERSQVAVTLRFLEGMAVKDIAARTGDSPAAVAMRLTRALRALRERLP